MNGQNAILPNFFLSAATSQTHTSAMYVGPSIESRLSTRFRARAVFLVSGCSLPPRVFLSRFGAAFANLGKGPGSEDEAAPDEAVAAVAPTSAELIFPFAYSLSSCSPSG